MTRRARRFLFAFAASALLAGGCQNPGGFIGRHLADDRRAEADRRWVEVRARVKLQLAQQRFDAGDLKEARNEARAALQLNPSDAATLVLLTKIELAEGRLAAARRAIEAAAVLPEAGAEVHYVAGIIAERYELPLEALEHYTRAAQRDPNESEYVLAQAETLVTLGRPAEALALAESQLADFDEDIPLRIIVAETAQLLGLHERAIRRLREAVRLAGDNPVLREKLGLALAAAGRHREAIGVLRPLFDAAPSPGADRRAATDPALDDAGAARRSSADCDAPPPLPGSSPAVAWSLARGYLALGDPVEALGVLHVQVRREPDDAVVWTLVAQVGMSTGNLDMIDEAAAHLRRIDASNETAELLRAYVALRRGDALSAAVAAESVLRRKPGDVDALCLLAQAHDARGDADAARQVIREILDIDPDCAVALRLDERYPAPPVDSEESGPADPPAASAIPDCIDDADPPQATAVAPADPPEEAAP